MCRQLPLLLVLVATCSFGFASAQADDSAPKEEPRKAFRIGNPFGKLFRRGEAEKKSNVEASEAGPALELPEIGKAVENHPGRSVEKGSGGLRKWLTKRGADSSDSGAEEPPQASPKAEKEPAPKPEAQIAEAEEKKRRSIGQWFAGRKAAKEVEEEEPEEPSAAPAPKPEAQIAEAEEKKRRSIGQWFAGRKAAKEVEEEEPEEPSAAPAPKPEAQIAEAEEKKRRSIGQWFADRKKAKEVEPEQEEPVEVVAVEVVEAKSDSRSLPRLRVPQFLRRPLTRSEKVPEGSFYRVTQKTPLYRSNPGMPPFSMSYRGGVEIGEIVAAESNRGPFTEVRRLHDGQEGFVNSLVLKRATSGQFLAWQQKIDDGYSPSGSYLGSASLLARRRSGGGGGASDKVFRPIPPPEGAEEPDLPSGETRAPLSSILFGSDD